MSKRARATTAILAACLLGGLAASQVSRAGNTTPADTTPSGKPPADETQVEKMQSSPQPAKLAAADPAQKDLIQRGEYLATAADCGPCHSGPAQPKYSGGYYMKTPGFGSIATPNITPDDDTGIGKWTADQFYKVLHDGIGAHGEYVYPVMPFPWYTRMTRADSDAIFAYLKSLPPAHAPRKPNELIFPFNIREGLLAWRTAFFHEGTFKPDPSRSEQLNRGAYIVNALAHCTECHGNALFGASSMAQPFEGGVIDNWYAPNITNSKSEGIGNWTEDQLYQFFKQGVVPGKTVAIGPMREVVHDSLSKLTDPDLHAIAAYIKSIKSEDKYAATGESKAFASNEGPGVEIYLNHCASCHMRNGEGVAGEVPPLKGNGAVTAQGPENVIRVVLQGVLARDDYRMMPALGADMTDQQIADVVNYVRNSWGNSSPEAAGGGSVSDIRKESFIALSDKTPTCYPPGEPPKPDATLEALDDSKNGVVAAMQAITPDNLINQTAVVVDKAHAAAPKAAKADLVNQLYHAYCPVVASEQGISLTQKRWELTNFTQLVYAQLTHPEKTVQTSK
jgi:mono/diheme cytochrome c family protein